jgi:hypothetical protein
MKICEKNHEVIAFETDHCPLCKHTNALLEKDKELAEKDEKIWELEGTVADYNYRLEQCQEDKD